MAWPGSGQATIMKNHCWAWVKWWGFFYNDVNFCFFCFYNFPTWNDKYTTRAHHHSLVVLWFPCHQGGGWHCYLFFHRMLPFLPLISFYQAFSSSKLVYLSDQIIKNKIKLKILMHFVETHQIWLQFICIPCCFLWYKITLIPIFSISSN